MSHQAPIELEDNGSPVLQNTPESPTNELLSPSPPPPSKYIPALIVAASFTLTFTACGTNFAFGIYQDLYQSLSTDSTSPFYNASPASIDLIGTLGVSLMSILAPFAGALIKSYHPRVIIFIGGALIGLGNILAGSGTHLWHFTLAQGVIVGAGTSLCYIPAVTVTPSWFNERRGLAMGIVLSGTGVGGVVWAPILHALNANIGYRNTLRFSGALSFVLISCAALVMRWDTESERRNEAERGRRGGGLRIPLVNWRIARTRKFGAQALGALLQAAAYYTPIYFFSAYGRLLGYSAAAGANFIAASNGASAVGKVVLGHVADKYGRLNTLAVCTLLAAAATLGLWLPSTLSVETQKSRVMFGVFSIFYGIFAGAYVSLFPTALVELFGVQNFSSVNGFLYFIRGVGSLIGTPAAGALLRGGSDASLVIGYEKLSSMVGTLMVGAAVACLWVRIESAERSAWRWRI